MLVVAAAAVAHDLVLVFVGEPSHLSAAGYSVRFIYVHRNQCGGAYMNLGDAKRDHLKNLADFVDLASSGKDLSVNTRRGLVAKLDQLHQQALSELQAVNKRLQRRHTDTPTAADDRRPE